MTVSQQCAPAARKANGTLGCTAQSVASRRGRFSSPLVSPESTTGARGAVLGSPVQGRLGTAWRAAVEGCRDGGGCFSPAVLLLFFSTHLSPSKPIGVPTLRVLDLLGSGGGEQTSRRSHSEPFLCHWTASPSRGSLVASSAGAETPHLTAPHPDTHSESETKKKTLVGCDSPFLVNSRRHTHTAIDGAREPRPAQCEPTRAPRWWRRWGTQWLRGQGRVTGAGCNGRAAVSHKGRGQSGGAPFSPREEPLGALPAPSPSSSATRGTMKKNNSAKRGQQDGNQQSAQPEKVGWVRKFCGKGIFREIWKNRYVVLKGDQLYISEKEVKDEKNVQEAFDLSDYEKCEELRKSKSRSKKNHSKFTLAHSRQPGNMAPNLIFLAVSPEEKESWINALNSAITRAKNRILDEVTVEEDSYLAHPTRDRAKIQHSRRPPTRGHLMAVASTSTSDGMLTLDLIQEEDASPEEHSTCEESFRVDLDKSVAQLAAGRRRSDSENVKLSEKGRSGTLPRHEVTSWDKPTQRKDSLDKGTVYTPQVPKKLSHSEKNKCASMEEILSRRDSAHRAVLRRGLEAHCTAAEPEQLSRLQELVALKLEKTQELLTEVKGYGEGKRKVKDCATSTTTSSSSSSSRSDCERILQESERLLGEASSTWSQARRVLQEVRELRDLYRQIELQQVDCNPKQSSQYRKSMM